MKEIEQQLSEAQRVLIPLLKNIGAEVDELIGVMLLLKGREEDMKRMCVWIYNDHPTPQQVLHKVMEIWEQHRKEQIQARKAKQTTQQ